MQLANESSLSPTADEDLDGETTLYFDAEEGTIRTESGTEIAIDMDDENSTLESEDLEEEDEDETQTPTAEPVQDDSSARAQTITSMSPLISSDSASPRRPSLARRLSSATHRRVSRSLSHVHVG